MLSNKSFLLYKLLQSQRDFSGDLDSEDVASGLKVIKICRMVST
uniref:Uncharacterized protein n=1 Tax=Moniliophthora roreri TaxID=221103 RepID=A0A0W0FDH0_MONRR